MEGRRKRMVEQQLRAHGVVDPRVLGAMATVPREEFVPPDAREYAYLDRALAIGAGQTISQPLVVGAMTQAADPGPDDTVLEVGTGSGYQAAVLSMLCRRVVTIEREPGLAEHAAAVLQRLGFANVEVMVGDGAAGYPPEAPYPAIMVTAAAREVPPKLLEQLADGGRMVIPVESGRDRQDLLLIRRHGDSFERHTLFPVRFVPLITTEKPPPP